VLWAATGPVFHFSDHWAMVIGTGNVHRDISDGLFLIQNTQNRDARAIHLKLNELIRAMDTAHNQMIDIERLSDLELDAMQATYEKIKTSWTEAPEANLSPLSGEMKRRTSCRGTRSTRRVDSLAWPNRKMLQGKDVSCVRRRALEIPCVPFCTADRPAIVSN